MNSNNLKNEVKLLRYLNISHIILILCSIYIYYIGFTEFYFISKVLYIFYKYSFLLDIIFIINPIVLLILVPIYKDKIKIFKSLKVISLFLVFISFIIGILINISVWMTSTEGDSFLRYCPYHYNSFLLKKILDKFFKENENNNHNKFKLCDIRLCYFYSEIEENILSYNYICNYDSSKEFIHKNGKVYKKINSNGKEIISNTYIACSKKLKISPLDKNLITYYNLCHNNLYLCELFEKPKEKDFTSINNIESCPGFGYTQSAYLLSISYLLINLICFVFLFFIEFLILRKIEHLLQNNINLNNNSTINSTNNKNKEKSNSQNKDEFKKEETDFIIVENNQQKSPIIEIQKKDISLSKIDTTLKIENNEKEMEFKHKKIQNLKISNLNKLKLINLTILENEEKEDKKEKEKEKENNNQKEIKKDNLKVNQNHKNKFISNFNSNPSFFASSEDIFPIENINKNKKQLKVVKYNDNDNSLNNKQIFK